MKPFYLILLLIIMCGKESFAQEDPQAKQQRIEALKTGFISQKLQLSPAESEKFWPLYYRYETELKEVHKEANNMDVIDKDEKLLNIRKKYKSEFSNVLGPRRVNSLFRSENEFRAVLLRHIQHPMNIERSSLPSARPTVTPPINRNKLPLRR